ncbi:MAG: PEP-utilizing enzyme [Patescibacteria group bacterium]
MKKKRIKPNTTSKKIWEAVEGIPQNTIFMMEIPAEAFFSVYPKQGAGNFEKEYFTYFDGEFSQMIYVQKEFNTQCRYLADKAIKKPEWALGIMKKVEEANQEFFRIMNRVKRMNLSKMSNLQIAELMAEIRKVHMQSHGYATSVSWHVDAGEQLLTKAILKIVQKQLNKAKIQESASRIFSILTSPVKRSLLDQEETSFLKIALMISKKRKLREVFVQSSLKSLINNLSGIDPQIQRSINQHYYKFSPITYQYKGPAYPLGDYLVRWQAFLRERKDPQAMLNQKKNDRNDLFKEQKRLTSEMGFSKHEKNILKMARQMVYIKSFRKDALYNAMYYYENIFKEVGKRFGLSVSQVQALKSREIITVLRGGKVDPHILNERLKKAVDYWQRKGKTGFANKVMTGEQAVQFMQSINLKKPNYAKKQLSGTCAYPGKVKGIVKIVNIPEDIKKMKQGDIMVAHNTNPNLVPAMKKASALIGGAGGLTCHTAIVAREMKIPCVVGVADCDKLLKDGDKISVDAERGIIKKL